MVFPSRKGYTLYSFRPLVSWLESNYSEDKVSLATVWRYEFGDFKIMRVVWGGPTGRVLYSPEKSNDGWNQGLSSGEDSGQILGVNKYGQKWGQKWEHTVSKKHPYPGAEQMCKWAGWKDWGSGDKPGTAGTLVTSSLMWQPQQCVRDKIINKRWRLA